MAQDIVTMLMFDGRAEEAMTFYTGLFPDSGIDSVERYGPEFPGGPEGQVVHARFRLNGLRFLAMDGGEQPFTFTPATSLFVTCTDEAEVDRLAGALSEGGSFLMPLQEYPFAAKYAWVQDRFGVSWQLTFR